jgi:hypothetical protein
MHGVAKTPLDEIDELIAELSRRREKLLSESARIQRDIVQLQAFSQSAVQSTKISTRHLAHFKIGTQRLSHLKKIADAPAMSGLHVESISNEEHCESGVGAREQHDRTPGDEVEAKNRTVVQKFSATTKVRGAQRTRKARCEPSVNDELPTL